MTRYIKCSRLNGLIIDDTLRERAEELITPNLFWVAVEPDAQGRGDWQRRQPSDVVSFAPLPTFADDAANPVIPARQGSWQHQADAAVPVLQLRARQDSDGVMRARLAQWCQSQPEGSEQAFIELGIAQPSSARYQLYQQALATLKREHGL